MPPSKAKPAKPEPKIDDPKKQKKFEKEEKEFRKKFKVWCKFSALRVSVISCYYGNDPMLEY